MTVYEKVLGISKAYLGPAAETFITRQCKSHLKKDPSDLIALDLVALSKWMEVGAGLVMDPAKASELARKVLAG